MTNDKILKDNVYKIHVEWKKEIRDHIMKSEEYHNIITIINMTDSIHTLTKYPKKNIDFILKNEDNKSIMITTNMFS